MKLEFDVRIRRPSGFSLQVAHACEAEGIGLVGPSGSGKSTLLHALAGIEPGARVVLDGVDLSRVPLERRDVGYVAQDALLFPHLTVRANLLYSPRASGLDAVPEALGIAHLLDRMPRNLSGGERRRVALARAIVSRPRVLLLDEPFAGLDEPRRREAMSLLEHARARFRLPMVLVSHLADEVIGLTQWTLRIDGGSLTAAGPSASVLRADETAIDNYFTARVVAPHRVRVGDLELAAMLPEDATGEVGLACYAHDILLAAHRPEDISARNVFPVRVLSVERSGDSVLAELEPPRLRALVTPEAVASLALVPGARVFAIVKATSLVYLGPR